MTKQRNFRLKLPLLWIFLCGISFASDPPANVAGTWIVSASNGRHTARQTLVIRQDGAKITGTFKGPRQSGTLDGSVTASAITFHVSATTPLDYLGTISGDTMEGSLSGDGKNGKWTARRSK